MADYPDISDLDDLDPTTPAGTEVASKLDDAVRQIKKFLTVYLAVSHTDTGALKAGATLLASIADNLVTYAKMQNVSATDRVLGRVTAGAGDVEEVVFTDAAQALCDDASVSDMRTTLGLGAVALLASIATANIDALAVTAAQVAANAITTAKIMDANVTGAKLTDLGVTIGKLGISSGSDAAPVLIARGTSTTAKELTVAGVLTAAISGSTLVFSWAGSTIPSTSPDGAIPYARLEERRAANTAAGATSAAAWVDRTGWTETDPSDLVSVSGANVTFKKAGVYLIDLSCPCSGAVGFHRVKLYNVTAGADVILGTTEQCAAGNTTHSHLKELITVSADNTVFKLQTWATNAVATSGLGAPSNQGGEEVYSIWEIVKA